MKLMEHFWRKGEVFSLSPDPVLGADGTGEREPVAR
jgi:hypothetical protein